ncbi:hypothetical protein, partial [Croceicoccus naphthovorans]|uniref:hypothetical protein n=2 Tax=Croceicoccus naphthovorans TaxID=1348774 RepID=UPI001C879A90
LTHAPLLSSLIRALLRPVVHSPDKAGLTGWVRKGSPIRDCFHCTYDKQEVRDEVFTLLSEQDFTVQATIMEKSKAQPQTRTTEDRFYQYGWLYHLKHSSPKFLGPNDSIQVTAATIGKKAKRVSFEDAVRDVCKQIIPKKRVRTAFWPAETDPCLQIADYCCWAIQRKWEKGDSRSYDHIAKKVNYEFDLWSHGKHHYF